MLSQIHKDYECNPAFGFGNPSIKEIVMENEAPCNRQHLSWYGITELSGGLGLFEISMRDCDKWFRELDMARKSAYDLMNLAFSNGRAVPQGIFTREKLDIFLKSTVRQAITPRSPIAIIDFTRTSLPQLSGKAARDAAAMYYYLGQHEQRVKSQEGNPPNPFLGFGNYGLVFDGRPWQTPKDLGEEYYGILRREHPLIILWEDYSKGRRIVHPDYDETK